MFSPVLPLILTPLHRHGGFRARLFDLPPSVESWAQGVEVAVSVLDTQTGPQALPRAEVVPMSEIYDYIARYTAGATEFFVPARLSTNVAHRSHS